MGEVSHFLINPQTMWKVAKTIVYLLVLLAMVIAAVILFIEAIQLAKENPGVAAVLGASAGALLAGLIHWGFSTLRRKKEYRSLLMSFAHELVEDFHRCVLYHRQQKKGEVSFSAIFNFNDASTLSRLAAVTDNPKIVDAIMFLKKLYFQVGRHVENASKFSTESEFIKSKVRKTQKITDAERAAKEMLEIKALDAQGTALAFFKGANDNVTYPKIVDSTELIVNELKKKWSHDKVKELEDTFLKDREELRDLENQKRQQQNGDQI